MLHQFYQDEVLFQLVAFKQSLRHRSQLFSNELSDW